jgi:hypothetical protein
MQPRRLGGVLLLHHHRRRRRCPGVGQLEQLVHLNRSPYFYFYILSNSNIGKQVLFFPFYLYCLTLLSLERDECCL